MRSSDSRTDDTDDSCQLCPSGRCRAGSQLIGVVGRDGRVGYVTPALELSDTFCETANAGRNPQARFRFTEPCAEDDCAQWDGNGCGLIDQLLATNAPHESRTALPRCGIRGACRWFAQEGRAACGICPLVITEIAH